VILARVVSADRPADLAAAFLRMGLPLSAREYLGDKLPHLTLLLTGLTRVEGRFLKGLVEACETPGREEAPAFVSGDQHRRPGTALLSGRREQLERVVDQTQGRPELCELRGALRAALDSVLEPARVLEVGAKRFELGGRTLLMGIVNVTPDSFSDGGRFLEPEAAIAHGLALVEAGADLLDIGGETTRPGSLPVSAEEELRRVLPVVRGLRQRTSVPLSVDTTKAEVARQVLAEGASMINDISGFTFEPQLAHRVAEHRASACLMHIQGTPRDMQQDPRYQDVVEEVIASLRDGVVRAIDAGIPRERLLVDPGIGFGKDLGHNLFLLRHLAQLRVLGVAILLGTSRKSFIGKLTGGRPATERLAGSLGSVAVAAVTAGADVVRVHDVEETRDALAVADAIRTASAGGELY